jgi:hypothetical protein
MVRALALAGALAGTTMIMAPAAAAPLAVAPLSGASPTIFDVSRPDAADARADWRCRGWRCGGWGGGWRGRGWRRNRIDGGDVLIGAAIIGGAIAIANSNRRRERDRDVVIVERDVRDQTWRDDDRRYDDRRFDDRRASPRGTGASGLDNAVNQCLDRIERDVRVDSVENVERTGAGWRVSGVLFNGSPFQCRIGNGGQIDDIDYGGGFGGVGFSAAPTTGGDAMPAAGQWDDSRYSAARAELGGTVRPDLAVQEASLTPAVQAPARVAAGTAMPAYPGGPIPGEVIPENLPEPVDGDL